MEGISADTHTGRLSGGARGMVWSWNVVWGLQGPRLGVDGKTKAGVRVKDRFGP